MTIHIGHVRHGIRHGHYIGRGSPLGNPFVIGKDGTREQVINKYQDWFNEQLVNSNPAVLNELKLLGKLAQMGDITLLCYCSPKPCHGQVIRDFLEDHFGV